MRRLLPALLACLLPAAAHATSGAGVGIPETGGPGAGAASADARGLWANPAAAVGSGGTEIAVDLALVMLQVHFQRAPYVGTDPSSDPDRTFAGSDALNFAPVPYFAIRRDLGGDRGSRIRPGRPDTEQARVGLGFSLSAPFGRLVHFPREDAGRHHLVTVDYFTAYATPAVSWRPIPALRVGAGPVIGISKITLRQRVDLAPSLHHLDPSQPAPAPEMALLEGEVYVPHAYGISYAWTAGAIVDLGPRWTIGASYIAGSPVALHGRSRVTPSIDFNVYSEGDFTLRQHLPPMANVGVRFRPEGPIELSFEGEWVGYSVQDAFHVKIRNSQIKSDQADTQALVDFLQINEGQLVEEILDKDQTVARDWQDVFAGIAGVEYQWSREMRSRFEVGYHGQAIPSRSANTGNVDFASVTLGASVLWEPAKRPWALGLALSQYVNAGRTVKNSRFRSDAPYESGYAYPSGNGTYSAVLTRLGLSARWKF